MIRFDIPPELKELTIAEKLLIRRAAPLIPAVHISKGIIGIKGHCVCWRQNIDTFCDTLPNLKCDVITYIREMTDKNDPSRPFLKPLKVRREKVISALKWLKLHHCGYHHITINENNLNWMKNSEECQIKTSEFTQKYKSTNLSNTENKEYVSYNQCIVEDSDDNFLETSTIGQNRKLYRPTNEDIDNITRLKCIAKKSRLDNCIIDFPSMINYERPFRCV